MGRARRARTHGKMNLALYLRGAYWREPTSFWNLRLCRRNRSLLHQVSVPRSGNPSASLSETAHTRLPRFRTDAQATFLSFPLSLSFTLFFFLSHPTSSPWFDQLALFLHAQRSRIVQRDVLYLSRLPAYFHRGVLCLLIP